MNDLLFIRHAATDMAGTFCGHSDPPVDPAGRQQTADLLEQLRGEHYDAVYTSDLCRASTTAAALAAAFSIPCIERTDLRETYFGLWEGLTWNEIEVRDPVYASRWIECYPNLATPGGEAFADFERRVAAETDWLLHHAPYSRALVVTHAGVMRSILQSRCMLSEQQAWARTRDYCCSFRITGVAETIPQVIR